MAVRSLALLAALLPACAAGDYLRDRGADLGDILQGHVMIGPGVDAMVDVTRALRFGAGWYEAACAGWHDRSLGTWHERVQEGGVFFLHGRDEHTEGTPRVTGSYGTVSGWGKGRLLQPDETWPKLLTIRATAFLGLGLDVEVRIGEAIDFVGGFFLWDPSHDDEPRDAAR